MLRISERAALAGRSEHAPQPLGRREFGARGGWKPGSLGHGAAGNSKRGGALRPRTYAGQYDEAETLFLESLRLREKIYGGKPHGDIGQSLHNIGLL